MFCLVLSLIWLIILFVYYFYIAINVFFRLFSYRRDYEDFAGRRDYEDFAGNEEVKQIDSRLHYYVIVPCFNEEAIIKKLCLDC